MCNEFSAEESYADWVEDFSDLKIKLLKPRSDAIPNGSPSPLIDTSYLAPYFASLRGVLKCCGRRGDRNPTIRRPSRS